MTTLRPTLHRPRIRPLAFAAASVGIVAITYIAVALGPQRGPSAPPVAVEAHDDAVSPPAPALASGSEALLAALDHEIGLWAASLAANEGDYIAATRLGGLHLQRARITGDLGDYDRALEASERAVAADPIFWAGHTLRATVLFALHDFSGALAEAQTTFAADPNQLDALAVIGDASLELGDLPAAASAYADLAEDSPSPPVWSRLAHLAFLRGDATVALEVANRAVAAVDPAEDSAGAAFYRYQLGELHRLLGNLPPAAAALEDSLSALDGYVPAAAALANVREAQGRRTEAIELLESAATARPQPEILAALGDLYALDGDEAKAEQQYALVERIATLARAGGGIYDRQLILFAADHGRGVELAVSAAAASLEHRKDVYGYDAYAWALLAAGRVDEASAAITGALALGTPDPRIAYHAGMIAAASGEDVEARQFLEQAVSGSAALPPLQAQRATEALAALGGGPDRSWRGNPAVL
jgi:tetratricopeptide (TPR) repeat protein